MLFCRHHFYFIRDILIGNFLQYSIKLWMFLKTHTTYCTLFKCLILSEEFFSLKSVSLIAKKWPAPSALLKIHLIPIHVSHGIGTIVKGFENIVERAFYSKKKRKNILSDNSFSLSILTITLNNKRRKKWFQLLILRI